jgi:hypothetical protein
MWTRPRLTACSLPFNKPSSVSQRTVKGGWHGHIGEDGGPEDQATTQDDTGLFGLARLDDFIEDAVRGDVHDGPVLVEQMHDDLLRPHRVTDQARHLEPRVTQHLGDDLRLVPRTQQLGKA